MLSNEEGNQLIKKYLKNNTVFAAGRVGSSEILSTYAFDNGKKVSWDGKTNSVLPLLQNNAGVYGPCGPQSCVCVDDVPSCVTARENIATDGVAKYVATFVNIPSGKSLISMFDEVAAAVLLRLLLTTSFVLDDIMLIFYVGA